MKYFIVMLYAVLSVTMSGLNVQLVGAAEPPSINQADIDVLSEADTSLVDLMVVFENEQATLEEFRAAAEEARVKFDVVANHDFVTEFGDAYTRTADALKVKAGAVKTTLGELAVAYEAGDEAALADRQDAFLAALDEYDAALMTFNDSIDQTIATEEATNLSYIVALIITGLVAVASFVWAFAKKNTNPVLHSAQKSIAFNSLWPLGGAVVTFVSYYMAQSGESYTIAWGAVLIGAVFFVKSIFEYFSLKKQTDEQPVSAQLN